ncbi:MAG TPA: hypothetical protein VF115_09295 [Acidimicrobiia bacterium]
MRSKAIVVGVPEWVDGLPGLIDELEADWAFEAKGPLEGGTESGC